MCYFCCKISIKILLMLQFIKETKNSIAGINWFSSQLWMMYWKLKAAVNSGYIYVCVCVNKGKADTALLTSKLADKILMRCLGLGLYGSMNSSYTGWIYIRVCTIMTFNMCVLKTAWNVIIQRQVKTSGGDIQRTWVQVPSVGDSKTLGSGAESLMIVSWKMLTLDLSWWRWKGSFSAFSFMSALVFVRDKLIEELNLCQEKKILISTSSPQY